MKTEGLTWAEAIKAYADGKKVRDRRGYEFWIGAAGDCPLSQDSLGLTIDYEMPCTTETPFSIVKPEPKRLSFDEAIQAIKDKKTLKIEYPIDDPAGGEIETRKPHAVDFALIDLAERRGWPISLAEE